MTLGCHHAFIVGELGRRAAAQVSAVEAGQGEPGKYVQVAATGVELARPVGQANIAAKTLGAYANVEKRTRIIALIEIESNDLNLGASSHVANSE